MPGTLRADLLFVLTMSMSGTVHAEELTRGRGETIGAFAKRVLPPKKELAAKAVEVKLGRLGTVAVMLFRPRYGGSNYSGWV